MSTRVIILLLMFSHSFSFEYQEKALNITSVAKKSSKYHQVFVDFRRMKYGFNSLGHYFLEFCNISTCKKLTSWNLWHWLSFLCMLFVNIKIKVWYDSFVYKTLILWITILYVTWSPGKKIFLMASLHLY